MKVKVPLRVRIENYLTYVNFSLATATSTTKIKHTASVDALDTDTMSRKWTNCWTEPLTITYNVHVESARSFTLPLTDCTGHTKRASMPRERVNLSAGVKI